MDPNAILEDIENAMQASDVPNAMNLCAGLRVWLAADGFKPSWQDYPSAYSFYTLWLNYVNLTEAVQALKTQV